MQSQPQRHSTPNIIQTPYLKFKSIQIKLTTLVPLTTKVQNSTIKNQNSSPKQSNKVQYRHNEFLNS
jgi:hypothetical protein